MTRCISSSEKCSVGMRYVRSMELSVSTVSVLALASGIVFLDPVERRVSSFSESAGQVGVRLSMLLVLGFGLYEICHERCFGILRDVALLQR